MSDETAAGKTPEHAKAEAPPPVPTAQDDHRGRLADLEAAGRALLHDVKLAIVHTETAAEKELDAAELRFQQFVHHLTLHFDKKPK